MSESYSNYIDPQVIERTVADDYQYEAKMIESGIIESKGVPPEGTHNTWIREILFQADDNGQSVGIGDQITLSNRTQSKFQVPVFNRASGAIFDDIANDIIAKRAGDDPELALANAVSKQAAQMMDSAAHNIITGSLLYLESASSNFYDTGATQIDLAGIIQALDTVGEQGAMMQEDGIFGMRSKLFNRLQYLGLIANASNTFGNSAQDEIVRNGLTGKLLGMTIFKSNKIHTEVGTDYYSFICRPGALAMMFSPVITKPFQTTERGFDEIFKFRIRLGGGIKGLSWEVTQSDKVSDAELAASTSWTTAKTYNDYIPIIGIRCPLPTFS